jgi:hypothetical protein
MENDVNRIPNHQPDHVWWPLIVQPPHFTIFRGQFSWPWLPSGPFFRCRSGSSTSLHRSSLPAERLGVLTCQWLFSSYNWWLWSYKKRFKS